MKRGRSGEVGRGRLERLDEKGEEREAETSLLCWREQHMERLLVDGTRRKVGSSECRVACSPVLLLQCASLLLLQCIYCFCRNSTLQMHQLLSSSEQHD